MLIHREQTSELCRSLVDRADHFGARAREVSELRFVTPVLAPALHQSAAGCGFFKEVICPARILARARARVSV